MPTNYLDCIEVEPSQTAKASIIWLHGLGADGHDFEAIVPQLRISPELAIRFIFPNAPIRAITINNGYRMSGWYDITGNDFRAREDIEGIQQSADSIAALIKRENERGVPTHKIIVAGFSQGAAIALHTGLRYPETLAGILALSGYLPLAHTLPTEASAANRKTSIMMAHGQFDPMVQLKWAEHSRDYLLHLNYTVSWHTYPMEHAVCGEEILQIANWIKQVL